jgi:hypothetical protein
VIGEGIGSPARRRRAAVAGVEFDEFAPQSQPSVTWGQCPSGCRSAGTEPGHRTNPCVRAAQRLEFDDIAANSSDLLASYSHCYGWIGHPVVSN